MSGSPETKIEGAEPRIGGGTVLKTMPGPIRTVFKAIWERLAGSSPSVLRALLASIIVGVAAAVATYKLLRSGS